MEEILKKYSLLKDQNIPRETFRLLSIEYEFKISLSIKLYA